MLKERTNNLISIELIELLRQLDHGTFLHGMRVGEMLYKFSNYLKLSLHQCNQLQLIGYVHDIGKLKIPISILTKQGPLTDIEWDLMKNHTIFGYDLLKNIFNQHEVLNVVRYHHENIDGSGYFGLCHDEIDINTRIIRIIDSFDALTHNRVYKRSYSVELSLKKIQKLSGTVYDEYLVNEFTKFVCHQNNYC